MAGWLFALHCRVGDAKPGGTKAAGLAGFVLRLQQCTTFAVQREPAEHRCYCGCRVPSTALNASTTVRHSTRRAPLSRALACTLEAAGITKVLKPSCGGQAGWPARWTGSRTSGVTAGRGRHGAGRGRADGRLPSTTHSTRAPTHPPTHLLSRPPTGTHTPTHLCCLSDAPLDVAHRPQLAAQPHLPYHCHIMGNGLLVVAAQGGGSKAAGSGERQRRRQRRRRRRRQQTEALARGGGGGDPTWRRWRTPLPGRWLARSFPGLHQGKQRGAWKEQHSLQPVWDQRRRRAAARRRRSSCPLPPALHPPAPPAPAPPAPSTTCTTPTCTHHPAAPPTSRHVKVHVDAVGFDVGVLAQHSQQQRQALAVDAAGRAGGRHRRAVGHGAAQGLHLHQEGAGAFQHDCTLTEEEEAAAGVSWLRHARQPTPRTPHPTPTPRARRIEHTGPALLNATNTWVGRPASAPHCEQQAPTCHRRGDAGGEVPVRQEEGRGVGDHLRGGVGGGGGGLWWVCDVCVGVT